MTACVVDPNKLKEIKLRPFSLILFSKMVSNEMEPVLIPFSVNRVQSFLSRALVPTCPPGNLFFLPRAI